jgi:hypothetical protein
MALDDIAKHSYYVLARKDPKADYVFAIKNDLRTLGAHGPPSITREQASEAFDLLKKEGYEALMVQYNPSTPQGVVNLNILILNDITPTLLSLAKKAQKAIKKQ